MIDEEERLVIHTKNIGHKSELWKKNGKYYLLTLSRGNQSVHEIWYNRKTNDVDGNFLEAGEIFDFLWKRRS